MKNASGHKGENECQQKKWTQDTQHYLHKTCNYSVGSFWKFHVLIMQNNSKEMCQKSVLLFSFPLLLSITRFILSLSKL